MPGRLVPRLRGGMGRLTTVQTLPRRLSANGWLTSSMFSTPASGITAPPTATQVRAAVHETPVSGLPSPPAGCGFFGLSFFQLLPVQEAATGCGEPAGYCRLPGTRLPMCRTPRPGQRSDLADSRWSTSSRRGSKCLACHCYCHPRRGRTSSSGRTQPAEGSSWQSACPAPSASCPRPHVSTSWSEVSFRPDF